ncbi:putative secreted protein [Candidatus Protofrankia californiensis]|uniref:Putative secreted protein n=1 Tax=Candidatus Protofrankia californiensis TaxID=1839754 RepID=A0A1C3P9K6_9ACTN|nr:putative secreted protein [Candidatus Protofrankia californiensis]
MGRRAVTIVTLVVSALLLHVGLPHHGALAAERSESRADGYTACSTAHAHVPVSHHGSHLEPIGSPNRSRQLAVPAANDLNEGVAANAYAVLTGSAHARTARNGWASSAGEAPTPAMLQTFRC